MTEPQFNDLTLVLNRLLAMQAVLEQIEKNSRRWYEARAGIHAEPCAIVEHIPAKVEYRDTCIETEHDSE